MLNELEILYIDKYFVIINKPPGLLVHKTKIADDAEEFALQKLRKQLGKKIYPVHRLDRKTSGTLIFAFDSEIAAKLQNLIKNKSLIKKYIAIVRGYFPDYTSLDYPLYNDKKLKQQAKTSFKCLKKTELKIPFGKHSTSRYSMIEACPETGRMHQIRKHCAHLRHPIIGDRPHGCNKQNKLFKDRWELTEMMLHARSVSFIHPANNDELFISANYTKEFLRVCSILKF